MTDRLLNTVQCPYGEVFVVKGQKRFRLASCAPVLKIHEKSMDVPVIGGASYQVKKLYAVLVLCDKDGMKYQTDVDFGFFSDVRGYDLRIDVPLEGEFNKTEVVNLMSVYPSSVTLGENWIFEVLDHNDVENLVRICGQG